MASPVMSGVSRIEDLGFGILNRILAADSGPRFQISVFRSQFSDLRFQISDLRFQIWNLRSEIWNWASLHIGSTSHIQSYEAT